MGSEPPPPVQFPIPSRNAKIQSPNVLQRPIAVAKEDFGQGEHVGIVKTPRDPEGGEGEAERGEDSGIDVAPAVHLRGGYVFLEDGEGGVSWRGGDGF